MEEAVTQETLVNAACDLFFHPERHMSGLPLEVSVLNTAKLFWATFTGSPSRLVAVGVAERLAGLDFGDRPALDGAAGWWNVRRVMVLTTLVTYR